VFSGRLIRVEVGTWPAGEREVVRHPPACVVVAFAPDGAVLLVQQVREAVGEALLELPAGIRDPGDEGGEACAARELLEETGYRAVSVRPLGRFYSSPGFTDEVLDLFVARAEPAGEPTEGGVEVVRMPLQEARAAVFDGRIRDAKTALGLLMVASGDGPPAR
jgi:ADP-ribose pyrophosphatase